MEDVGAVCQAACTGGMGTEEGLLWESEGLRIRKQQGRSKQLEEVMSIGAENANDPKDQVRYLL